MVKRLWVRRRQLDLAVQERDAGRRLLLAAWVVVGANLLLVAFNLWRGWQDTDYFYLLNLGIWVALLVVQSRIHRRRQGRVEQMTERLEGRR